ncbi:MAG: hypothetical protein OXI01_10655 [Albidovulum sp.]|nr:hypothetical protein [Albidovulum sp.]
MACEQQLAQFQSERIKAAEAEQDDGSRQVMLGFMRRYDLRYVERNSALSICRLGRSSMIQIADRNVETPVKSCIGAIANANPASQNTKIERHMLGTECFEIGAGQPKRFDDVVAPVPTVPETSDNGRVAIECRNDADNANDANAELAGKSIETYNFALTSADMMLASSSACDSVRCGSFAEAHSHRHRAFLGLVKDRRLPENCAR